jgi:hypothetical protein
LKEAAIVIYVENNGCTAMSNAPKPTSRAQHMDIKYFSLCELGECNLMIFDGIDTSINMADHLTKALQPTLFHCHVDFLLSHTPPTYSPVYQSVIGHFLNHNPNIDLFVPESFTTPLTATAAQVHVPIKADYQHNPWLIFIGHG